MIYLDAARGTRPQTIPIVIEIQMAVCPGFKKLVKQYGFEGICRNAELSAQCTVMPITDLGVDVTVENVVDKVAEIQPQVLGLSALLTTTMPEMENVIHILEARGMRAAVKVMVGGAPLSAEFAQKIGADAFGKDAAEAVHLARSFINR